MNAAEIVGLTVGGLAILTTILGGVVWLIRATIAMQRDLTKPNGGSSTRDSLNRIERDLRQMNSRLDDHIEWHMDQK